MTDRIVPQCMTEVIERVEETAKTQETARVSNMNPDICAVCGEPLIISKVNGLQIKVCIDHNLVMPLKD